MNHTRQPWRIVRLRRKQLHSISTKRIIIAQIYTIIVAGFAGYLLSEGKDLFVLVGGALVLYPGISDLTSSNATSLSAHIHHDMDASPEASKLRIVLVNFFAALSTTIIAALVLGIIAGLISNILFVASVQKVILLSVSAGALIGLFAYPLIIGATLLLRSRKFNPDDVVAPIESSIIGVSSIVVIVVMSGLIG
jgi:cation transporter-like permease